MRLVDVQKMGQKEKTLAIEVVELLASRGVTVGQLKDALSAAKVALDFVEIDNFDPYQIAKKFNLSNYVAVDYQGKLVYCTKCHGHYHPVNKECPYCATKSANAAPIDREELSQIFKGYQPAIDCVEATFKRHEGIETVIVNPDSWVGKELLTQTGRIIDLRRDVMRLESTISILASQLLEGMPNVTEK